MEKQVSRPNFGVINIKAPSPKLYLKPYQLYTIKDTTLLPNWHCHRFDKLTSTGSEPHRGQAGKTSAARYKLCFVVGTLRTTDLLSLKAPRARARGIGRRLSSSRLFLRRFSPRIKTPSMAPHRRAAGC